ncbi:phosphatidylinositol 4-phosphate 3-kinase C2 domain-containing subunit alpha isoform X2 [Pectinophora gossypiella]|uniref:phosphatidylinositol 4-phosphate 3-kinase C2 domain-containing subunit alpha isoform X2 n=1 Tax=Pectinophora gossypiella TaxID=13191 RepID=UPI00214F584E|nr:phosphatidylinositol 4-phosphate 3-kinase C2 domain-containing subunit alpha isoform X2 [Pectinophora gossypiella]
MMSEYDLQFQADLEKAQALSLESLALEQFRRQKLANAGADNVRSASVSSRRREDSEGPPPALPPPPRKPARARPSVNDNSRSTGASPTHDDSSDLISFSSPTSKSAPKDAHASLKEYIEQINRLGQQTEELTLTPDQSPIAMNNQPPSYPPRPGYPPTPGGPGYSPQYPYYTPPPYTMPPYPPGPVPYMPTPMPTPMPNYPYYAPMPPDPNNPYPQQIYPNVPYTQTRMASPSPYVPYQPAPAYNYSTTNMIARPPRPTLYPSLSQVHVYPPTSAAASPSANNNHTAVKTEPSRDSVESNASRKSSEVSVGSNESNDTVGSLPKSLNLIDFGGRGKAAGSVRVSVLEAFDPLLTETNNPEYAVASECSSSVYEEYDPLEFLYGETEMRDAPVYATISKKESTLPSPPPKSIPSVPAVSKRNTNTTNKLYDCIVKTRSRNYDSEHRAFLKMVLDVRKRFTYSDEKSNPGHVIAARSGGKYPPNTSIKILVHHAHTDEPITFTSDVESTVEHVILTVVCSLDEDIREDMSGYMLRVWGAKEYLTPGSSLSEYDYIRECVRLEKDVRLCLHEGRDTSLARSERDDVRDSHLTLDDLMPNHNYATPMLSFDNLSILLETLEGELSRAIGVTGAEGSCSPKAVFQAVKAICALAGGVETLHLTHALNAFAQSCTSQGNSNVVTPEIHADNGPYCNVSIRSATAREAVAMQCGRVRDAVRSLVALYSRTRLLDFQLAETHYLTPSNVDKAVPAHTCVEATLFCIEAVHCLPLCWSHDEYMFHGQVYHGTRPLKTLHLTQSSKIECAGFYPRIIFDTWLSLEDLPINILPRESRLVLTLYGRTQRSVDNQNQNDNSQQNNEGDEENGDVQFEQVELGWAAIQMFDYDGMLASGHYILPLWPPCCDRRIGPAPHPMNSPPGPHPVVNIEIPLYEHTGVKWSCEESKEISSEDLPAFDSLDGHTQSQLLHLIEQGAYQRMPTECREVMWEKRQYLVQLPGALPLVLLAATNWYGEQRAQLIALLKLWEKPSPLNAMHLLLPCFPDAAVREIAAKLINQMSDDDLCRVLPQLAQALRHETFEAGPLAEMLLSRALSAPAVAHRLFWLLVHSLPNVPQAPNQEFLGISLEEGASEANVVEASGTWRYRLLLRALLALAGENLTNTLMRQQLLVKTLSDVAMSVKNAKETQRQRALLVGGERLAAMLRQAPAALPLALHRYVHDVDVKTCSYFSSNTLPLKINFIGSDNAIVPAMFKVGDDLRQDSLVLQVIKVMDSLWLKAGLDLRIVTFQALPTSDKRGMIEIVSEAETLRAIQTEWGLTGSFKDKPIAEWLAKHNPSELEYQRARDNFTASCAGYSVATYLLGICDRHNDNIMLKTSGHLFHIDFGKFLGDAQMFGNFKRDRAPFVLTHDMVYVINGGERPTQRFQHFVELCCMAFNIVRAHHQHILDLFALMAMSGVGGVTSAAVSYVRAALLPAATNAEAAAAFARLIHSSLKSKFTPINFFLHNLAQLRASGDQSSNTSELLSFMPRTYTMAQEGRLVSVECLSYEKRYDPEKHYVYALRIYRQGQATPFVLYRSYKHFTELYQKICLHFPLAKVHSLPSGLHVGRSNTRQVAERRFGDVQAFLTSLFSLADEIAHSDLVYTFFHPLLRDQQDVEPQRMKNRETTEVENSGSGSLKLSVQYAGGVLSVLILHAQSLALTPQGLPPNPYVKVYLVPDPTKETKRKTRVLKRNSHPSFMEMLEYRLPIEVITNRSLQATVWHYDSLQENQFLGGVVIPLNSLPLRQETVAWYPLEYIPR